MMPTYTEGSITSTVDPGPCRTSWVTTPKLSSPRCGAAPFDRPSERSHRTRNARRWHARRLAVATLVIAGAVVLSACDNEPDAPSSDPASLTVDRFLEVFNAEDADELARIFGDDVVLTVESGAQAVGADAATFWQQFFGPGSTAERITDAFRAADGRTYFVAEFGSGPGSTTQVLDVEMDDERLVSMGIRPQNLVEADATSQIDNLYAAFNDQDLDRLIEEFEGITYTSPSGEDLTGAEAAEHWADEFGSTVMRTTGVFALGDGSTSWTSPPPTAVFTREHTEPAGSSTAHAVEIEMFRGRIISMTERTPQN